MTLIVGLDLSTRRTGVALPAHTLAWPTPTSARTPGARLHWIAGQLHRTLPRLDLVVTEGVPVHTYPGALAALAQVHGVLRLVAHEVGVEVVEINPTHLKRYATGKGNAPKEAMVEAAQAAGATVGGDDEADAWLLRALGVLAMDGVDLLAESQGADPGHRLEVVSHQTWPVVS